MVESSRLHPALPSHMVITGSGEGSGVDKLTGGTYSIANKTGIRLLITEEDSHFMIPVVLQIKPDNFIYVLPPKLQAAAGMDIIIYYISKR